MKTEIDRFAVKSVLVCLDDTNMTKIGDSIVRLSRLKFLQHYFPTAKIQVNSPSKVFLEVAKHSETIESVTRIPMELVELNDYDVLLLYVDKRTTYSKHIEEYARRRGKLNFSIFSIMEPEDPVERAVPFEPLPRLSENYPADLLDDVQRNEICLTVSELEEGTKFLDEYISDEKLIVFFVNASSYTKSLKMSVTIELIRYFQKFSHTKLLIFDPFNDKELFFKSMGTNVENALIVKGKSLRETFAIIADERVNLIFGPCTGLMHAASGIYNFLMKNKLRLKLPTMVVYTGLYYEMTNAAAWWRGSLVKCMVLTVDEKNNRKAKLLEELMESQLFLQEGIAPTYDYTLEMIKGFLQKYHEFESLSSLVKLSPFD